MAVRRPPWMTSSSPGQLRGSAGGCQTFLFITRYGSAQLSPSPEVLPPAAGAKHLSTTPPPEGVQSWIQGEIAWNRMSSHPIRGTPSRDGKVPPLLSTPWDGRLSYS